MGTEMKKLFAGVLGIFMGFIGPAHADEDTYNYLLSQYASEGFNYEVVVRSELALPECSAIWEIYLTLRSLGAEWMNVLFPDAGGRSVTNFARRCVQILCGTVWPASRYDGKSMSMFALLSNI